MAGGPPETRESQPRGVDNGDGSSAESRVLVEARLKPSNVFVTVDEEGHAPAKVLDFGIAKLRLNGGRRAAFTTQKGVLLGTPPYMSPEQARGRTVDHRADVWALAVIAYHMLTGELPFDADSADELFARIVRVTPIPIHDRAPALATAFEQLEPRRRYGRRRPGPFRTGH